MDRHGYGGSYLAGGTPLHHDLAWRFADGDGRHHPLRLDGYGAAVPDRRAVSTQRSPRE
jgi:hypothetical protein